MTAKEASLFFADLLVL